MCGRAYVTTLTLGEYNKTQTLTGLVDTGSGIVHFPCLGCTGAGCDNTTIQVNGSIRHAV